MLARDAVVRAAFVSVCATCLTRIQRGHSIHYDVGFGKFVHSDCARVRPRASPSHETAIVAPATLPTGLKPATLVTYRGEWDRYERFVRSRGHDAVPGRDSQWDLVLLWAYMQFRALTCKPTTVISSLSALAHSGACFGKLLATSKYDCDSVMYRRLTMMKRQLAINYHDRCGGVLYGPNRCTPLGRRDVSLLFSAFGVVDEASFMSLPRIHRHNLAISAMQHSEAMRFGHFAARAYVVDQFKVDSFDGVYRLMTDWHRYSGRHRYCLRFQPFPAERSRWYELRNGEGVVVQHVSAATILS